MNDSTKFKREDYIIKILTELAEGKEYEGNQIGPQHTLEQIQVIADLIEHGSVDGKVLRARNGRPVCIGFPRITSYGREHLTSLVSGPATKVPLEIAEGYGKKVVPPILKWIAGIAAAILVAWLVKRLGLR
jgi:hypothetical protein